MGQLKYRIGVHYQNTDPSRHIYSAEMTSPTQPVHDLHEERVAVIGGGIAGLAAAHRLLELRAEIEVTLFEASDRLGGVLHTHQRDGFLIEQGADNFLARDPWAVDLCRRVGLGDQLSSPDESHRRAFVVRRGRLLPVPEGFVLMAPRKLWPIVTSPVLSPWGKLRLACEPLVPRRRASGDPGSELADESVASFARRRLGEEAFERLVQPLLAGIYTADAERLSIGATMPQFLEYERSHGSVLRGIRAQEGSASAAGISDSGARYSQFVAPKGGMGSLVNALAMRLPAGTIRLNSPASRVTASMSGGWQVTGTQPSTAQEFSAVVLATPSHVTAQLLYEVDPELCQQLVGIGYASSAVVSLGYRRDQIAHPLDGFGFVVPQIERRRIVAGSFASVKYAGRAPQGHVLIRVFIGGALQPELLDDTDQGLVAVAIGELSELLGVRGEPVVADVARWPTSMPQYHVGHLARVAQIEHLVGRLDGLALAGNALRGVGIPQCIHSGEQAAERIAAWLTTSSESPKSDI